MAENTAGSGDASARRPVLRPFSGTSSTLRVVIRPSSTGRRPSGIAFAPPRPPGTFDDPTDNAQSPDLASGGAPTREPELSTPVASILDTSRLISEAPEGSEAPVPPSSVDPVVDPIVDLIVDPAVDSALAMPVEDERPRPANAVGLEADQRGTESLPAEPHHPASIQAGHFAQAEQGTSRDENSPRSQNFEYPSVEKGDPMLPGDTSEIGNPAASSSAHAEVQLPVHGSTEWPTTDAVSVAVPHVEAADSGAGRGADEQWAADVIVGVAQRVRAGEIVVASSVGDSPEAVLAKVLATLLTPRQ